MQLRHRHSVLGTGTSAASLPESLGVLGLGFKVYGLYLESYKVIPKRNLWVGSIGIIGLEARGVRNCNRLRWLILK